jgi:hypothetical protein
MSMNNFSSFPYSTVEVLNGYAILRLIGTRGGFTCYTVGMGGKSFQTLKAARTFARRLR